LAHGLLRASFVPEPATEAMRTLLRTRKQLVREKASHTQRLQKTLEDANIKLDSVISNVLGKSGRAILEALIAGETDPGALAARAQPGLKASTDQLRAALRGRVRPQHRFLLGLHLRQIDALDAAIAALDAEVEAGLAPFRQAVQLLTSIPGVGDLAAQVIVAEIGTDMSRFPTAGHLLSWAGLCPLAWLPAPTWCRRGAASDESAGKRRSNRLRKGAPWLKTLLVQCAWAASRKKASYLQAQFHRLRARRGAKKAICAVAASILTAAYHMLKDGTFYQDLGPHHFDRGARSSQIKRLGRRLTDLGYAVEIKPLPAAA
jgi:transposase